MSAPKTAVRWGVKIAKESTYGTFVAPANSTDGVLVQEPPDVDDQYKFPGDPGGAYGTTGPTRQLAPAGRFGTVPLVQEVTPPPSAYASGFLENARISIHRLLELNGHVATFDSNGPNTTPRHYYAPQADPGQTGAVPYASGSATILHERQQYDLAGCYVSDLEIAADSIGAPLRCTAQLQGTMPTIPQDLGAYPAITYSHYNRAPIRLLNPELLSLPGYTTPAGLRMKAFKYRSTRELDERGADAGGNHAGWTMGKFRQELTLTFEASLTSIGDPRTRRSLDTLGQLSLCFGGLTQTPFTGAGSRMQLYTNGLSTAQVINFDVEKDGKTVLWTTTWLFVPTTLDGTDSVVLAFH